MDRQQIGLKLTVEALALSNLFGLKSFDDRLILQKAVYLAQVAGLQLGYHFHWYLRGPYSPGLTKDAFAISTELAEGQDDSAGWKLDPDSQTGLQKLEPLLKQLCKDPSGTKLARKMELLASVHFLVDQDRARAADLEALERVLRRFGKDFTREEIQAGLQELTDHGLWPTEGSR